MKHLLLLLTILIGQSATLEWDQNPEINIAGYRVYWGRFTRSYDRFATVLYPLTTATITNLWTGTNYFAVTAFDDLGLESDFSDEVWTFVPISKPGGVRFAPLVTVQSAPTVTGPWTNLTQVASGIGDNRFYRLASAPPEPPPPPAKTFLRFVSPKTGKL